MVRLQGLTIHDLAEHNGDSTPLYLHCSLSASRQRTSVRCELCQKQRVPFPTISNKEAIIELPSRLQLSNATTASYEDRPMGSERQGRLPAAFRHPSVARCTAANSSVWPLSAHTDSSAGKVQRNTFLSFRAAQKSAAPVPPAVRAQPNRTTLSHTTAACSPPRIALRRNCSAHPMMLNQSPSPHRSASAKASKPSTLEP